MFYAVQSKPKWMKINENFEKKTEIKLNPEKMQLFCTNFLMFNTKIIAKFCCFLRCKDLNELRNKLNLFC